jgi:hypothetical protein
MTKPNGHQNAFEALCALASREGWCWKMVCTTCGHMVFRYGFMELSKGKHPDASDWIVHWDNKYQLHRMIDPVWGCSGQSDDPSKEDQIKLISILSRASILRISRQCRFPAWLGYLGLGLSYTEPVESQAKQLTTSWKPQLLNLITNNTNVMHLLKLTLFDSDHSQLRWQDLERVEKALIIGLKIRQEKRLPFS